MKLLRTLLIGAIGLSTILPAQGQRAFTPQELEKWERITSRSISNDGKWVAVNFTPWRGDQRIEIHSTDGKQKYEYTPASNGTFSSSAKYFLLKKVAALAVTDSLKLKKAKQMPMDKVAILGLENGKEQIIDSIVGYRTAESHDYMAYQRLHKDSALNIVSLDGKYSKKLPSATSYAFAQKSATLYYITNDTTDGRKPGLYIWSEASNAPTLVKAGKGNFKHIAFNEQGDKLAFLYTDNKKEDNRTQSLWVYENGDSAACEIITRTTAGVPQGWVISRNYGPWFSKDNSRIFLGTAPEPLQKDTTILDSNRPDVQIWNWDEPVQYTVQTYNVGSELNRSYVAVYHMASKKLVQIADSELPNCQLPHKGIGEWAILSTSRPYSLSSMWEGRTRHDHYKVSLTTGERTPISSADYASYRLSPGNKYAAGYNPTDSCWYTVNLQNDKNQLTRISTPTTFVAWDEENDMPDYPSPHGYAGWTKDDGSILIYDRHDVWSFHPEAKRAPINLTKNGRSENVRYRRIQTKHDESYIDTNEAALFVAFGYSDKTSHIYSGSLAKPQAPKQLTEGDYHHTNVIKAKKADRFIFARENCRTFPDVWTTDKKFKKQQQLTQGTKQQKEYIWSNVELIKWKSLDGIELEGLLYKPDNFDPTKKYPMIVNFYERSSHELHHFPTPEPNRSTVDYSMYLSNGYIIFNPDVRYGGGYPGKSCYNCVIPGVEKIVSFGYIDEKRIGAQGHSWGGYQVAYLATRTNMFAAIESGAPVVNMFSAYGGIRWGSGRARAFQYEHTQSRLGGTPWSHPERYEESSPLFNMDKVQTPILIMHNDQDGHVPWYQGIEYFVALKRLGKPAWLLNYPGEPHWPMKFANRVDFQIRMKQFFDHYLKGEPMPKWMKDGVPAVSKQFELGY